MQNPPRTLPVFSSWIKRMEACNKYSPVEFTASTSCIDRNLFPTYFLSPFLYFLDMLSLCNLPHTSKTLAWSNPCLLVARSADLLYYSNWWPPVLSSPYFSFFSPLACVNSSKRAATGNIFRILPRRSYQLVVHVEFPFNNHKQIYDRFNDL